MPYTFDHWNGLPKVSCTCITYGRPNLLEEAVHSFLDQDYPGEAELCILNDDVRTTFQGENLSRPNRQVRIFNASERYETIGGKRNECTRLAAGAVILPWDDDDIHLPWRISLTIARMKNCHHWKATSLWYWTNGLIRKGAPTETMAPSMAGYSKEIFEKVGGYNEIQSGQDQTLENKFKKAGVRMVEALQPREVYYLYRFGGTGSYHLSSHGYGNGYEQAERHVARNSPGGTIQLSPHYKQDYLNLVKDVCANLESADKENERSEK